MTAKTVTLSTVQGSVSVPIDRFIDATVGRRLAPPAAESFTGPGEQTLEFLPAPSLDARARQLIDQYEELAHLAGLNIVYLWKAAGGKTGGKAVLGKCQKISGLARYLSGAEDGEPADFIIWLAADHLKGYDETAIEAVLYHECCHIGWDEDADKPVVVAHEFAGFLGEIERYGLYALDLQNLGQTIQLRLPETGGA